jgi:hypothetical protein
MYDYFIPMLACEQLHTWRRYEIFQTACLRGKKGKAIPVTGREGP